METVTQTTPTEDVQQLVDQSKNLGTYEQDKETLAGYASEAGTTLEALDAARTARNEEAQEQLAKLKAMQDPHALEGNAPSDNWRNQE